MGSRLETSRELAPFARLTACSSQKVTLDGPTQCGNLESSTGHKVRAVSPENSNHYVPVATVLLTVNCSTGSTFKDPSKAVGGPHCRVKPDGPSSTGPVKRGPQRVGLSAAWPNSSTIYSYYYLAMMQHA
jgi:hypothetical protein